MFRSDHPCNYKMGGVCVYYKATLPLRILNVKNLSKCFGSEVSIESIIKFTIES